MGFACNGSPDFRLLAAKRGQSAPSSLEDAAGRPPCTPLFWNGLCVCLCLTNVFFIRLVCVSVVYSVLAKMEKCKNAVFFKGGVGNARRADRHNRHFVGRGPPDDLNSLTYPQHGANIRQHRPNLGQHRPNIGPTQGPVRPR